jgi:nicotinate-nucleotide adenylyltransferase
VKIALLGGSFDPVHVGHLSLAEALHRELAYDLILLVPANAPPHKDLASDTRAADRLAMLRLAITGRSYCSVDDCELARGGVSYTVDTVRHVIDAYRANISGKPAIAIGEDLVPGFSSWKDVPTLLELADIVVARRPRSGAADGVAADGYLSRAEFPYPHVNLENKLVDVSSTLVRERISSGAEWASLVPEAVYRYIVSHTLYEHGNR